MIPTLVIVSVSMLALAGVASWTARRSAAGTLARNDLIGIRTVATQASDAAWIAAHRAGAADLRRSAIVAVVTAVLPWCALLLPGAAQEPVMAAVIVLGAVTVIGFSVRAAVVGGRAAREVTDRT
ncbi:SdpI family protein [Microbacterium sp. 5K110]|uniref:SdpI family protein n=1 Tax=unclassified Microbacterium TaxID=2609290 RepID=UPI0010FDD867|nr:SdpI family protein [Microbacterium sp. 5K110]TLF33615.1 SdpI family protein [Microbacterium sp. 5K110]